MKTAIGHKINGGQLPQGPVTAGFVFASGAGLELCAPLDASFTRELAN